MLGARVLGQDTPAWIYHPAHLDHAKPVTLPAGSEIEVERHFTTDLDIVRVDLHPGSARYMIRPDAPSAEAICPNCGTHYEGFLTVIHCIDCGWDAREGAGR